MLEYAYNLKKLMKQIEKQGSKAKAAMPLLQNLFYASIKNIFDAFSKIKNEAPKNTNRRMQLTTAQI